MATAENGAERIIDLRSDTVTKPTPEMRKVMAEAEVGDDVFGDDPTINQLQRRAAEMFGKQDALFVPSGTMGNLIAVMAHCKRGDELLIGDQSHIYLNEQGGIASLGGVFPRAIPTTPEGTLPLNIIRDYIRGSDIHHPTTRAVVLENTHNWCAGKVIPTSYVDSVGEFVKTYSQTHAAYKNDPIKLHMDGARIFNASVFLGEPVSQVCKSLDSISVCLSKGLGAPVGSVLIGDTEFIARARRLRKVVGGGMRQAGILAAAGLYGLNNMVDRLAEDHANAKLLADSIRDISAINVLPADTNIIFIEIKEEVYDSNRDRKNAQIVAQLLKQKGVWVTCSSVRKIRFVLHHHITSKDVIRAAEHIHDVFAEL